MKDKLKAMFIRNIGMKLFSFVLAFLVWIIIMSISDPEIAKRIDGIEIETRHKDDFNNLEANEDISIDILTTGTLSIKVKGKRSDLENLEANDFVAYADFNDFVGINAIPIKIETRKPELMDRIEVTYQSESVLQVHLVSSETRLINVVVEMTNVPEDQYALCKSVSSKLLEVTGPAELVETIGKLVASVDISTMSGSMEYVSLYPVDLAGERMEQPSIELSQSTVLVEISLLPVKEVAVNVDISETLVANGFGIYDMKYSPVTVRIAAEEDVLKTIREIKIPYTVEEPLIKEVKPIARDFDVTKYLPANVYLKSENAIVSSNVTVEAKAEKELKIPKSQLEFRNLPEEYVIHEDAPVPGEDEEITIVISGFKPETDKVVSAMELHPYVDLSNVMKTGPETFRIELDTTYQVSTESTVDLLINNNR